MWNPGTSLSFLIVYLQLDEGSISHEGTLAALRQKHNAAIADMGEQIDALNKAKAKWVKVQQYVGII